MITYYAICLYSDEYMGYYNGKSYATQTGLEYPGISAVITPASVKMYITKKDAIKEGKILVTNYASLNTFGFKVIKMPDTDRVYEAKYKNRKLIMEQKL